MASKKTVLPMKSMVVRIPLSTRVRSPASRIGSKLALFLSTVGHTETISSMPRPRSSFTMASGRPAARIELPVSLQGPMEEVTDDDGDRQAALLVLPRHRKELLLGLVAKLALPEAHGELGHHGNRAADCRVSLLDGRGVARS